MAENKKSVLLYCDIIHTVEELDDIDAGLLFKHYLRYINDQNPEPPSKLIKIVFEPIKQNLKRDLKKWEEKSAKNSESARIRWGKTHANAYERTERNANHADKDTVTVKDKVKVNVNENVIEYGIKNEYQISVKKVYIGDKIKLIYDLRKYFSEIQLQQFSKNGWIKFDEFMKENPGRVFDDDDHVYNSFKNFHMKGAGKKQERKLQQ